MECAGDTTRYSRAIAKCECGFVVSLPPANLPDLIRYGLHLFREVLESLLLRRLSLRLVTVGEVRLQNSPPAVVQLGPFLPAKHGAAFRDVAVGNEEVLQPLRVA